MQGLSHLKLADTVLFLGAGASEFAGYKTFRDFGDLILDSVLRYKERLPEMSVDTPRLIAESRTALERMHRPATHDNYLWLLTDYHNFCGKFDTHAGLQARFPKIKDEVHSFDTASMTVINDLTKTTFCHYSRPRDTGTAGEEVKSLYEELAIQNKYNEPFLPIFTTNYDLLIEDLFTETRKASPRVPLVNGIPGRTRHGSKWTPKAYEASGIHLYRLHGCVSWFKDPQSEQISFNRPDEISGDLLSNLCVMFPGRELERGIDPHGFGFKTLYSSLLTCQKVLFIGFSFRDDDVMHILLAANASRKRPFRYLVIDPRIGPTEVLKNLRGAARRSAFRVQLPQETNISCLNLNFGKPNFKNTVLKFINHK